MRVNSIPAREHERGHAVLVDEVYVGAPRDDELLHALGRRVVQHHAQQRRQACRSFGRSVVCVDACMSVCLCMSAGLYAWADECMHVDIYLYKCSCMYQW